MSHLCNIVSEPNSVNDAFSDTGWKQVMDSEFNALHKNEMWNLVPYDSSMNEIQNMWIFKVKHMAYGSLDKFKARLIANGF